MAENIRFPILAPLTMQDQEIIDVSGLRNEEGDINITSSSTGTITLDAETLNLEASDLVVIDTPMIRIPTSRPALIIDAPTTFMRPVDFSDASIMGLVVDLRSESLSAGDVTIHAGDFIVLSADEWYWDSASTDTTITYTSDGSGGFTPDQTLPLSTWVPVGDSETHITDALAAERSERIAGDQHLADSIANQDIGTILRRSGATFTFNNNIAGELITSVDESELVRLAYYDRDVRGHRVLSIELLPDSASLENGIWTLVENGTTVATLPTDASAVVARYTSLDTDGNPTGTLSFTGHPKFARWNGREFFYDLEIVGDDAYLISNSAEPVSGSEGERAIAGQDLTDVFRNWVGTEVEPLNGVVTVRNVGGQEVASITQTTGAGELIAVDEIPPIDTTGGVLYTFNANQGLGGIHIIPIPADAFTTLIQHYIQGRPFTLYKRNNTTGEEHRAFFRYNANPPGTTDFQAFLISLDGDFTEAESGPWQLWDSWAGTGGTGGVDRVIAGNGISVNRTTGDVTVTGGIEMIAYTDIIGIDPDDLSTTRQYRLSVDRFVTTPGNAEFRLDIDGQTNIETYTINNGHNELTFQVSDANIRAWDSVAAINNVQLTPTLPTTTLLHIDVEDINNRLEPVDVDTIISIQDNGTPETGVTTLNFDDSLNVSAPVSGVATISVNVETTPTEVQANVPATVGELVALQRYKGRYTLHAATSSAPTVDLFGRQAITIPATLPSTIGTHEFLMWWSDESVTAITDNNTDDVAIYGTTGSNLSLEIPEGSYRFTDNYVSERDDIEALQQRVDTLETEFQQVIHDVDSEEFDFVTYPWAFWTATTTSTVENTFDNFQTLSIFRGNRRPQFGGSASNIDDLIQSEASALSDTTSQYAVVSFNGWDGTTEDADAAIGFVLDGSNPQTDQWQLYYTPGFSDSIPGWRRARVTFYSTEALFLAARTIPSGRDDELLIPGTRAQIDDLIDHFGTGTDQHANVQVRYFLDGNATVQAGEVMAVNSNGGIPFTNASYRNLHYVYLQLVGVTSTITPEPNQPIDIFIDRDGIVGQRLTDVTQPTTSSLRFTGINEDGTPIDETFTISSSTQLTDSDVNDPLFINENNDNLDIGTFGIGERGVVPAPTANDNFRFLRGDGQWAAFAQVNDEFVIEENVIPRSDGRGYAPSTIENAIVDIISGTRFDYTTDNNFTTNVGTAEKTIILPADLQADNEFRAAPSASDTVTNSILVQVIQNVTLDGPAGISEAITILTPGYYIADNNGNINITNVREITFETNAAGSILRSIQSISNTPETFPTDTRYNGRPIRGVWNMRPVQLADNWSNTIDIGPLERETNLLHSGGEQAITPLIRLNGRVEIGNDDNTVDPIVIENGIISGSNLSIFNVSNVPRTVGEFNSAFLADEDAPYFVEYTLPMRATRVRVIFRGQSFDLMENGQVSAGTHTESFLATDLGVQTLAVSLADNTPIYGSGSDFLRLEVTYPGITNLEYIQLNYDESGGGRGVQFHTQADLERFITNDEQFRMAIGVGDIVSSIMGGRGITVTPTDGVANSVTINAQGDGSLLTGVGDRFSTDTVSGTTLTPDQSGVFYPGVSPIGSTTTSIEITVPTNLNWVAGQTIQFGTTWETSPPDPQARATTYQGRVGSYSGETLTIDIPGSFWNFITGDRVSSSGARNFMITSIAPAGVQGPQGEPGPQGNDGPQGIAGPIGLTGSMGNPGDRQVLIYTIVEDDRDPARGTVTAPSIDPDVQGNVILTQPTTFDNNANTGATNGRPIWNTTDATMSTWSTTRPDIERETGPRETVGGVEVGGNAVYVSIANFTYTTPVVGRMLGGWSTPYQVRDAGIPGPIGSMGLMGRIREEDITITQNLTPTGGDRETGITDAGDTAWDGRLVIGNTYLVVNDSADLEEGREIGGFVSILCYDSADNLVQVASGVVAATSETLGADTVRNWGVQITGVQMELADGATFETGTIDLSVSGPQGAQGIQGDSNFTSIKQNVSDRNQRIGLQVTTTGYDFDLEPGGSNASVTVRRTPIGADSLTRLVESIDWLLYTSTPSASITPLADVYLETDGLIVEAATATTSGPYPRISYANNRRLGGSSAPIWYQIIGLAESSTTAGTFIADAEASIFVTNDLGASTGEIITI